MLRKLLEDVQARVHRGGLRERAAHAAGQAFAEYKANRTEMPPDLGEQIPYVRQSSMPCGSRFSSIPGFEADDVIGTIARAPRKPAWRW